MNKAERRDSQDTLPAVESVLAKELKEAREQEQQAAAALPEKYQNVVDEYDPAKNAVEIPKEARDVATNKERFDIVDGMEMTHMKMQARISGALRDTGDALVGPAIHEAMNKVRYAQERDKQKLKDELNLMVSGSGDPLIAEKMLAVRDLQDLSDKYHDDPEFKAVSDYYNARGEFLMEAGQPADVAGDTQPDMRPFGDATRIDDTAAMESVTPEAPVFNKDLDVFEGGAAADHPEEGGVDPFAQTQADASGFAPTAEMPSVGGSKLEGKDLSKDLQQILNYGARGSETLSYPGAKHQMQEDVIKKGQRVVGLATRRLQEIAAMQAAQEDAQKQEKAA